MRCGSTWLYEALKQRPDIAMSSPKQLQFFNKMMLTRGLDWYAGHFRPEAEEQARPVRGEITPFYSRLSEASVANIRRLLPEARIVLTIRNPVERVWSHILYDWGVCKKKNLSRVSTISLLNFLHRQRTIRYTDYEFILRRWRRHFGDEAVHVERFERIKTDPAGMMHDVLVHIHANPDVAATERESLQRPVYSAKTLLKSDIEMPPAVRWALAVQWLPKMRSLNEYLNGQVSSWVETMEESVKGGAPSWRAQRAASRFVASLPERMAYRLYDRKCEFALQRRWSDIFREAAL